MDLSPLEQTSTTSLLISTLPRISIFHIDCRSYEIDDASSTEVNTPLLPKGRRLKSKNGLPQSKSKFGDQQPAQEARDNQIIFIEEQMTLNVLALSVPSEPLSATSNKSEFGSSSCGDESPILRELRRKSPRKQREDAFFGDIFYKKVEDYLDSEHLFICGPDDHRRSAFNNLRVSTARIPAGNSSDKGVGSIKSEFDSPSMTISPSIHTSSLFQRRSSSKDLSRDGRPSVEQKPLATKSPFFSYHNRGKGVKPMDLEITKHIKEHVKDHIKEHHDEGDEKLLLERTSYRQKTMKLTNLNIKIKIEKVHEEYHEGLSEMSTKSAIEDVVA
jgi:hypothetical protein